MNCRGFAGIFVMTLSLFAGIKKSDAQKSLSSQEYVAVTMDLQGVLELKMTTDPQVDFVFNSMQTYRDGITKFDATILEVNSTVAWDLYVQPSSQYWTQQAQYGNNNNMALQLPCEILELNSGVQNYKSEGHNLNTFVGITSNSGSNVGGSHPGEGTQFLAGESGTQLKGFAMREVQYQNPISNKFNIHYRIKPGLPATFPDLAKQYPSLFSGSLSNPAPIQPGYYTLEIVYTLAQDL